jgi:hypothetical protein
MIFWEGLKIVLIRSKIQYFEKESKQQEYYYGSHFFSMYINERLKVVGIFIKFSFQELNMHVHMDFKIRFYVYTYRGVVYYHMNAHDMSNLQGVHTMCLQVKPQGRKHTKKIYAIKRCMSFKKACCDSKSICIKY